MKRTKNRHSLFLFLAFSAGLIFGVSCACRAEGKNAHSLKITFTCIGKHFGTMHWEMDVSEPFRYLIPEHQDKTDMGAAISECSQAEYLTALDKSLTRFHRLHPHGQIDRMLMGYFTVREIWAQTRKEMRSALSRLPGKKITMHDPKNDNLNEPPIAAWTAPEHVLQTSPKIEATRRVFLKHGFRVTTVDTSNEFWFKESLNGCTWAKIGALPDAGIATPGDIEFVIAANAIPARSL